MGQSDPRLKKRRRWWQRWSVRLGAVVLAGAVGLLFLLYRTEARIREALARLDRDDPGWRFDDIIAARATVPDAENGAIAVMSAAALLPAPWPPNSLFDAFTDVPANQHLQGLDYGQLCNELAELESALAEARRLAALPRGRASVTYVRPNLFATNLANCQQARNVAALLELSALRCAEDGAAEQALTDCRAIINAGRSIGDEPFLIAQLVRCACVVPGCTTSERVLGLSEPPPDALLKLQRLLEEENAFPGLLAGARGERAMQQEYITAVERGELPMSAVGAGKIPAEEILGPALRSEIKNEHPGFLSLFTRYVEVYRLPEEEQHAVETAIDAEVRAMPRTQFYTRFMLPAITSVAEAWRRKQAYTRTVIAALAAERYRRMHERWPETLADLVPAELPAVPHDPFDGQPLRFRHLPDGIMIYSIGSDRTDDGGNLANPWKVHQKRSDTGIRLWDADRRGQRAAAETETGP